MNRRGWIIPILIVVITVLAVVLRWRCLPDPLPAHFDLQGNPGGSMPRSILLMYPVTGAVICLISYVISHLKHKFQIPLIILATGICLILLSSAMVTITSGKYPFFMLAEPVILLAVIVAVVVSVVKSRRNSC